MAIRLKYDPIGPLFLASFQGGLHAEQERRRIEAERQRQRMAEAMLQSQSRGQVNKNLIPIAPAPIAPAQAGPVIGAQARADRAATYQAGKAARRKNYLDGIAARRAAYQGLPAPDPAVIPGVEAPQGPAPVDGQPAAVPLNMPRVQTDALGNQYVDPKEVAEYERGVRAVIGRKVPDEELDPNDVRKYNNHKMEVEKLLSGRIVDKNSPDTWNAIEQHLAEMNRIWDEWQAQINQTNKQAEQAVAQQQEMEATAAADQAKVQADQAQADAAAQERAKKRAETLKLRKEIDDRIWKRHHPDAEGATPEQKAANDAKRAEEELAQLNEQVEKDRIANQLRLNTLNSRIANGERLTVAEETERSELARQLEMDANQQLADIIYAEEQNRVPRPADANAQMNAGVAIHTTGPLAGLPVTGPGGRHYPAGTEFHRDAQGRIMYRSDGIPLVKWKAEASTPSVPIGGSSQPTQTPVATPRDANQELVDNELVDAAIRARYGITGNVPSTLRDYYIQQHGREQANIDANEQMYAGMAKHTTGALAGIPVTGPDGRHYPEGTEFHRRADGSIIYRKDGFPMVKRKEKPDKPLGKVGSQRKSPTPAKGRGDIPLPPTMPPEGWLSGYGLDKPSGFGADHYSLSGTTAPPAPTAIDNPIAWADAELAKLEKKYPGLTDPRRMSPDDQKHLERITAILESAKGKKK